MEPTGTMLFRIHCILVLFWIPETTSQVISLGPENAAILAGQTATLRCEIQQNPALTDYISWEECITPTDGSCRRISNDDNVVYVALGGDATRGARYSVQNPSTGQYNLVVTGTVRVEDAGVYRCNSRNDAAVYQDAQLIILDSNPICTSNITEYTGLTMTLPSDIGARCTAVYSGGLAPVTDFSVRDNAGAVTHAVEGNNESSANIFLYTSLFTPQHDDHGNNFTASTHFTAPLGGDPKMADNAPAYVHDYDFGQITASASTFSLSVCMAMGVVAKHLTNIMASS